MTSLNNKKEFKAILLDFISNYNLNELDSLKKLLFDSSNENGDHPSTPGKPKLDNISSTGEKAFQRGVINASETYLDYKNSRGPKKVRWLDIELPVTLSENPRRPSIDLIGSISDIPVLCELKYLESSPSNHPIYGVVELLIYYYFIQCNHEKLDKYKIHHQLASSDFKWSEIANSKSQKLLLVANSSYWKYWFDRSEKHDIILQVHKLEKSLNVNIDLFESDEENEYFIKQKGDKKTYKPLINNKIWHQIKYNNY